MVYLFVQALILVLDLLASLIKLLIPHVQGIRERLVAIDLILVLVLEVVPCLVHLVQLVGHGVVVGSRSRQLLLHLVIVDLKGVQLQLILVRFHLVLFRVFLQG